MKKKIYFLAPKTKGGTYFYYKNIVDYLKKKHNEEYDIVFCNSLFDYIKLHFQKADFIFSIIPFIFKPIRVKKYIFNLHGNYKIERKNKGLGVKLLYLIPINLWFSDIIMLTSYFLADKLNFRQKYNSKIKIVPNFVEEITEKNMQLEKNKYHFLTITAFNFYKKGKGIMHLGKVIKKIAENNLNQDITFSIVGNDESENGKQIMSEFALIDFPKNVTIYLKGWLSNKDIKQELLNHNTFLYWSDLDNMPGVILDAINYNLRVFVNNFESFEYFLPKEIICKDEEEMVKKIERLGNENIKIDNFCISKVAEKIIGIIQYND